ncbi:hypothetical protein ACP70R_017792 [Stipagrostis hirtigluma subsp. patula]
MDPRRGPPRGGEGANGGGGGGGGGLSYSTLFNLEVLSQRRWCLIHNDRFCAGSRCVFGSSCAVGSRFMHLRTTMDSTVAIKCFASWSNQHEETQGNQIYKCSTHDFGKIVQDVVFCLTLDTIPEGSLFSSFLCEQIIM